MAARDNVHVLVTGGSGFLGRAIVAALLDQHPKWQISVLDRTTPDGKTLPRLAHFCEVDIISPGSVNRAFEQCTPDVVVHTAGMVPSRHSRYSKREEDWELVKSINCDGTRNVLDATLTSGCMNFVYTSSCTVATDDLDHDYYYMDETMPIGFASLHYGKSKGLAEQYVLDPQHAEKGLNACALRPCTILGPGDTAVISVIHELIAKGETTFIVGDGDNVYDFMYLSNAVDAHLLAVENLLTTKTAAGQAFFISNQEPIYFWDLFAYIWAQFGHVPTRRTRIPTGVAYFAALVAEAYTWLSGVTPTLHTGSVKDGVRTQFSNNDKARSILGYVPRVGLAEGVRLACEVREAAS